MTASTTVLRLLLVEDDRGIRGLLANWLTAAGHEVSTASDFEAAKAALDGEHFDVLITDVRLGAFNGLQLAWRLRDRRPETPILVISAFADEVLSQEAGRCGATYWVKSTARAEFLAIISQMAESRQLQRLKTEQP